MAFQDLRGLGQLYPLLARSRSWFRARTLPLVAGERSCKENHGTTRTPVWRQRRGPDHADDADADDTDDCNNGLVTGDGDGGDGDEDDPGDHTDDGDDDLETVSEPAAIGDAVISRHNRWCHVLAGMQRTHVLHRWRGCW